MSKPSRYEWDVLRPELGRMYQLERLSAKQIVEHLQNLGYAVNERMVKHRLGNWGVRKTNREHEMITALWLLQGDELSPSFSIAGQTVQLQQVVSHFRKKGIHDPVSWVRDNVKSDFEPSPNVELIRQAQPDTTDQAMHSMAMHEFNILSTMQDYCLRYLASPRQHSHVEPLVHRDTSHGRFGELMQQGLFNLNQQCVEEAFVSIRAAFLIIPDLVKDDHPMELSLYMAVLCELLAYQRSSSSAVFGPLAFHMLHHAIETSDKDFHHVLKAVFMSQDYLYAALLVSQFAVNTFTTNRPGDWKTLYIKERYCDSLYHAGQGSYQDRRDLLLAQEAYYTPYARNVLWTMSNVADDYLTMNDFAAARFYFDSMIDRANNLNGFYRAKIRFAAYEGLARTKMKHQPELQTEIMQDLEAAHTEAVTWFEPTSRRTKRVEQQMELVRGRQP